MMSEKVRNALGAFAMMIIVVGPVLGLFALVTVMSQDPSAATVGEALGNVIQMVVYSVLGGGVLRALVSIDARLDHRS